MDMVVAILGGAAVAVFGAAMVYAVISDLRAFRVPNWVSGLVVASFLVVASTNASPWPALLGNLITGLAVLAVGFALFAAGLFGAGDVKLLAAIALWIGWPLLIAYLLFVALSGGVLCLILIVFRRFPLYARLAATRWIQQLHARKKDVPYAVAIAIPAVFFLPRIPIVADIFLR